MNFSKTVRGPSRFKVLGLVPLLLASTFIASCAGIPQKKWYNVRTPDGKLLHHAYSTSGVSGSIVTADGSIGIFALGSVSLTKRGSLTLTFYRLTDSREPLTVHRVRLSTTETMTDGRDVRFNDDGVSSPVQGRFHYSSYFPAIPIQVEFSASGRTWSREIELRHTITEKYLDAARLRPKAPRTVTEFSALQPFSTAPTEARFPATERP